MAQARRSATDRLGPYELVAKLGQGAMGEVWEAVLHGPGGFRKPVAVKLLAPGRMAEPRQVEAILREARLGARLQHPNVVGTLGLSEHDGTWVVALELVKGATVAELLNARAPLPPHLVLEIGVQVAAGLAHVHEAGLVHRDVKPGNLLVDRSGLVRLADLGVSLLAGEVGDRAGTPGYVAPEHAEGRAEARSDLFSLGATLCVLATGRRPFGRGPEALEAARRVEELLAGPELLGPVEAAVPGLGEVVHRCLRADPARRWPHARALADALAGLRARQTRHTPTLVGLLADARPGLVVDSVSASDADAPTRVLPIGNVPSPRDRFVGRAEDTRALSARVTSGEARLLSLLGPGGMGKTRLALEVARTVRTRLAGGAWAFDLTEATTEEAVCAAVARVLDLEPERRDPVGQVGRALAARGRALLVFDNLEQCVEHLPRTLGRWLDLAPEATFLATSRVALGLVGEERVLLGPLPPEDAEALFVERASRPVTDEERPDVRALCAALDGVPLALQLAAARVRLLGVARIRERLGLELLSGGGRDLPERHRSLAASLAWSTALLSAEAGEALGQLAVFEEPFPLEAAEAVLELQGAAEALSVLDELVDASLLRVDPVGDHFSMLGVVRAYARSVAPPAARSAAERRHASHFAQLGAVEALDALSGPGGPARRRRLGEALGDLVAACRRSVARGDAGTALPTLRAASAVLHLRGPFPLAVALAEEVRALPGLSPAERGAAAALAGAAHSLAGRSEVGRACFEAALADHRATGDRRAEGRALRNLGIAELNLGNPDRARASLDAALRAARDCGDRRLEGQTLAALGSVLREVGRPGEAQLAHERALALHREVGDRRFEGVALSALGNLHRREGRSAVAQACYEQALAIDRELGNRRSEAVVLGYLGILHSEQDREALAVRHHEAALALHRELGDRRFEAVALGNLGHLHLSHGRLGPARACLTEALALHRAQGDRRHEGLLLGWLGSLHDAEGDPAEARRCLEAALALHRELGARLHEGDVLRRLALVSSPEAAERWLDAAEALVRERADRGALAEVLLARAALHLRAGRDASAPLAEARALAADRPDLLRELGAIVRTGGRVTDGAG